MKAYLFLALCCTATIAIPCLAAKESVNVSAQFDAWDLNLNRDVKIAEQS